MNNRWLTLSPGTIIGHRGASADAPENTLLAFQLARTQGAVGIEFDVHLAADGVLVCIHDDTLDRTTDHSGPVTALTSADLQRVDAGRGEPVPTLDAVFEALGRDFLYNVEIKAADEAGVAPVVAAALACIGRHNLQQQVVVSSFEQNIVYETQQRRSGDIALAMLTEPNSPPFPDFFAGEVVHPWHPTIDAETMAWAAERGYVVNTWTVDDPADAARLKALGVRALITNKPSLLRGALR